MDYAKPSDVIASMINAGEKKLALCSCDLLIRGVVSGALLGAAATLAFTGVVTTELDALIFPVSSVFLAFGFEVSAYDWWVWNQIPVTLGQIVGGLVFTGLALYVTYKPAKQSITAAPVAAQTAAE